jgi:hypothetical protein
MDGAYTSRIAVALKAAMTRTPGVKPISSVHQRDRPQLLQPDNSAFHMIASRVGMRCQAEHDVLRTDDRVDRTFALCHDIESEIATPKASSKGRGGRHCIGTLDDAGNDVAGSHEAGDKGRVGVAEHLFRRAALRDSAFGQHCNQIA